MRVLKLKGKPEERGLIHGETFKSDISETIGLWKETFQILNDDEFKEYIGDFLKETNFLSAINKWAPGILEEVNGIAKSANVDKKIMLAFQCLDEFMWYGKNKKWIKNSTTDKCSALGIFKEKEIPVILAQTLDFDDFHDKYQIVLHIKDEISLVEQLIFTVPGFIGFNGMNNHSIGIVCNSLSQLRFSTNGLPVSFIIRGVLEQSNFNHAVDFVKNVPHATGQNYIIGGPDRVISLECSANKVSQCFNDEKVTRIYHTNHPFSNDDINEEQIIERQMINSKTRLGSLEKRLNDDKETLGVDYIKKILSSHDSDEYPICRHKGTHKGFMTIGCSIMVLSDKPEFHFAPGPGCKTKFEVFDF